MTREQSVERDLVESEFDPLDDGADLHIDPVHSWKILGHGVADWVSVKLPEYLSHVLMFPAKATADSNYLRAALGNIWLIFPAIGAVLGIMAALDVAELPIPPATWIFCAIMALGILDAFAGMIAFVVFFVMVTFAGDFSTLHAITGIVGLAILWFGAAQLAHAFRPIGLWDEEPTLTLRIWRIGGDLIILPIIGAFLLSRLVRVLPFFTGLKVPIVEQKNLIWMIALAAFLLRAGLETIIIHNYRNRISEIPPPHLPGRHRFVTVFSFFTRGFVVYLLVWAFLGNTLPTFIVVGLFLSFEPIIYLGQRFPESTVISRLTPKNLLKLAIIILVAELLVKEVGKHFTNPTQLMGWTFVSLGVFVVVFLVFEQFSGKPWPETWIVRVLGAASIVFFLAVAQGWLAIG